MAILRTDVPGGDYLNDQLREAGDAIDRGNYAQGAGVAARGLITSPFVAAAETVGRVGGEAASALAPTGGAIANFASGLTGVDSLPSLAPPVVKPSAPIYDATVDRGGAFAVPPRDVSVVPGPVSTLAAQSNKPYDVTSAAGEPEVRSITNATLNRAYGDTRTKEEPVPVKAGPTIDPRMDRTLTLLHQEFAQALKPGKNPDFWGNPLPPDYNRAGVIAGHIAQLQNSLSTQDQAQSHRLTAEAQAPLYGAQAGEAQARASKEAAQVPGIISQEAQRQQVLKLQQAIGVENDPVKLAALQRQLYAIQGKPQPKHELASDQETDANGMPIKKTYIIGEDGVPRPVASLVPKAPPPPGMKMVGSSGGKPVYEDAQGKRFVGQ